MSLKEQIEKDFKKAMLSRDERKKRVLSLIKSQIHNQEIAKQGELTDEDVMAVIKTEIKQRKESEEAFSRGGRVEQAAKEKSAQEILTSYLPEQMAEEKIEALAKETIKELRAASITDMGKVMSALMPKLKGKAEGLVVSNIVKKLLL